MNNINTDIFEKCISQYLENCKSTNWTEEEVYKFEFGNWLNKKLNMKFQTPAKIYEICYQSQKEYYSGCKNKGIQFIIRGARKKLSEYVKLSDAEIFKYLVDNDGYDENLFSMRSVSYPVLSAWLGAIFPSRFMCVSATDFGSVIKYLFNLDEFANDGYVFFEESQPYFRSIKEELKKYELNALFLPKINDYLLNIYPDSPVKKKYDEYDWNWLTEDFALFVLRVHLGFEKSKQRKRTGSNTEIDEESHVSFNETKDNTYSINTIIAENDSAFMDSDEEFKYPEEFPDQNEPLIEGAKKVITINAYERNQEARKRCIEHWGSKCFVCKFDFYEKYGKLGFGYIHVHHLIRISSYGMNYEINPITDLRPVCPNCHAMLHRREPDISIEELHKIINLVSIAE